MECIMCQSMTVNEDTDGNLCDVCLWKDKIRWRKIADEKPEDGQLVIFVMCENEIPCVESGRYNAEFGFLNAHDGLEWFNQDFDYWMPMRLPEEK